MRQVFVRVLIVLAAIAAGTASPAASAEPSPGVPPLEMSRALGQMVMEAQQREAAALMRAYVAESRAAAAEAETKARQAAPPGAPP